MFSYDHHREIIDEFVQHTEQADFKKEHERQLVDAGENFMEVGAVEAITYVPLESQQC